MISVKDSIIFKNEQTMEFNCCYRLLTTDDRKLNQQQKHLEEYLQNFPLKSSQRSSKLTAAFKHICSFEQLSDDNKFCIVSNILNEENTSTDTNLKQIFHFIEKNKQNQYKNILSAFKRHIDNCQDERLASIYQLLSEENWNIEHIKKRVNINLKNCGRLNLKIKNLITNNNLKKIFIHFLKNCEELWLNNSKILDKQQYKDISNIMIEAYEKNILQNYTKHYKKKK